MPPRVGKPKVKNKMKDDNPMMMKKKKKKGPMKGGYSSNSY